MADKICRFKHGHTMKDKTAYRVDAVETFPEELAQSLADQRIVDIEGNAPTLKKATAGPSKRAVTR